jgi:hypothetical protein
MEKLAITGALNGISVVNTRYPLIVLRMYCFCVKQIGAIHTQNISNLHRIAIYRFFTSLKIEKYFYFIRHLREIRF